MGVLVLPIAETHCTDGAMPLRVVQIHLIISKQKKLMSRYVHTKTLASNHLADLCATSNYVVARGKIGLFMNRPNP